ncbi:MAG TPA: hypothetical protein VGS22_29675 [Thermoanaerobaculia bacterium]|jgi:hypothetical protein|nr:hypothetical protein [Thermoanaerobaculia bacterium]
MKKKTNKLVLSKETLKGLVESGDLKAVVGGSRAQTNCVACESGFYTCPSATGGCASYLC